MVTLNPTQRQQSTRLVRVELVTVVDGELLVAVIVTTEVQVVISKKLLTILLIYSTLGLCIQASVVKATELTTRFQSNVLPNRVSNYYVGYLYCHFALFDAI